MSKFGRIGAWCLSVIGAVAMIVVITHGFVHGNFGEEGRWLIDHPWGRVTLVDLYLGFFLFGGWVIKRERSGLPCVIWIVALMMWGHLAGAIYVIKALLESNGDGTHFWMGLPRKEAVVTGR